MAERKEIIRVLGFIQEYFDNYADEQETDKRKELFKDWSDTVLETIALLKAQEPRVMMLEEVKAFEWDYCYLEQERQPGKEYRMIVGDYALTCITWPCIASMRIVHGDDSYGVKWRCWDKKPTDEQRENTPWIKN